MYLAGLLVRMTNHIKGQEARVYLFCLVWLGIFVAIGLYAINSLSLYFTDKIFIVVVSWALPVKTASYCIDQHSSSNK
jgi:hypothetical protein